MPHRPPRGLALAMPDKARKESLMFNENLESIVAGIEIGPKPIQAFRALEREAQRIDKHMLHSPITIGQPGYGHTRPGLLAQLSFDEAAHFSR